MGAYLSQPKTEKNSADLDGEFLRCGACSMQGWRTSQEDAHNCILDFDTNASLFAVYDGHGGHDVSEYCSRKLPDFIKTTESYKKGNYEEALKEAFLDFDALLTTPDVIKELHQIAGTKDAEMNNPDEASDSENEEAIDNLVQEAHMPLEEVMAKYKVLANKRCLGLMGEEKPPASPMLRARRTPQLNNAGCSTSAEAGPSCSSASEPGEAEVSSSSSTPGLCNGDIHINGELEENEVNKTETDIGSDKVKNENLDKTESPVEKSNTSSDKCKTDCDSKQSENGLSNCGSSVTSSSTENGKLATDKTSEITSTSPRKKRSNAVSSSEIYNNLLQCDSDSEDETFVAEPESEDESSDVDGAGDSNAAEGDVENEEKDCEETSSVDEEEEEEDDDEEDDEDEEETETNYTIHDVPGSDSGSTAVVALLVDKQLYVANAGDSRCVVGRNGKAVEMSFDHKPEDDPERQRIEAAGGIVSSDGRVNNGLNLSRAIGDHSYKQSKDLSAREQMITALPDVKTLTINPEEDAFMVIACDGIWNSMTSEEVVSFIYTKLEQKTERLSQICEELFDYCLAPNTLGDGTGCDNMTCVIVQFKSTHLESKTQKRPAEETEESSSKRSKVEEEISAS